MTSKTPRVHQDGILRIGVLGPLVVEQDGRSAVPTAPKPLKVLAMLSLRAMQIVPVAVMFSELWGDDPPASALMTLQTCIVQIRKLLSGALHLSPEKVGREILVTTRGGYTLNPASSAVDVTAFTEMSELGRRAAVAGDTDRAAHLLKGALDLWRGPALVDVPAGRVLHPHIMGLEERRLAILEDRIEVDLRLGRHRELIGELTTLVAENPLHDTLYAHLMLALYRSGRRSDALMVFQRMQRTYIEELGLDPAPSLHLLQQRILMADPTLTEAGEPLPTAGGPGR